MKKIPFKLLVFGLLLFFATYSSVAQYSSIDVGKKHQEYRDSIKNTKYDYIFPIWGQKVYEKGFDIPFPAGLMANFVWMDQNITIDNMQLGFKSDNYDVPLTPVDFIEFGENSNTSYAYNVRPDLWVLPFFNVYGLFGGGSSNTKVNLVAPIELGSEVEQNITTKGFGVMFAGGVRKMWFSVDANWTWNKPELLDDPVRVKVLGVRVGKTFKFKNRPQSNFAFWIGGMRTKMDAETRGQISLGEALPGLEDRADQIVSDYNDWYAANYDDLNFAQKKVVDEVFDPIVDAIDQVDGTSIIRYGMDKQVQQLWNGVVGGQYQLNKRWQFRAEGGIIGNRKSFLVSANYRFLL
ncbi:hypothetical protein [Urechidicola vernalis]|uniref:Phenol degradation protein meta n=1 Tax=Urechidicola vernalis TaxID=3075600 RepID=A0ABU2Y6Q5_9FLAO|nr:hypothetical protein [Urechidicola sp. P050]MDT0553455.1 hypothetical protein [Urechidicola sp. P050]